RRGRLAWHAVVEAHHHLEPHRRGARHATHVSHGLAGDVADPHADRVAARVAHGPVVTHLLARARLDRGPEARGERALEAERDAPALAVGENARDLEGGERRVYPRAVSRWLGRGQPERAPEAARGQRAIGADHLPEAHVRRAQRERWPVEVA